MVDIRTDIHDEVDRLIDAGVVALEGDKVGDAHRLFREAYEKNPNDPRATSYYGLTMVLIEDKLHSGLEMCIKACRGGESLDPLLYLNLGRLYIKAGKKREAVGAFRRGLQIDSA